ncbi:hypothetical protein GF406_08325 [candidate division KSB1 bacterium]|nr:hypothetical protein [candidate division KSB1 bacterium]
MKVLDRLAELSSDYSNKTILCLEHLIQNGIAPMLIHYWQDYIRTIIENAIRLGKTESKHKAKDLVHLLGQQQFFQFRDLLSL